MESMSLQLQLEKPQSTTSICLQSSKSLIDTICDIIRKRRRSDMAMETVGDL
jgi:hypothetical protein